MEKKISLFVFSLPSVSIMKITLKRVLSLSMGNLI